MNEPQQLSIEGFVEAPMSAAQQAKADREALAAEGRRLRDEGIANAWKAADERWRNAAYGAMREVCAMYPEFTTDEVWELLDGQGVERPREPRAMAGVLRKAQIAGLCSPTGLPHRPSRRPEHHAYPLRVWRSHSHAEEGVA